MKKISAYVAISRIFDPLILISILGVIASIKILPSELLSGFLFVFFFGMIVPPVALLIWALKTHRVSNWDVSSRRQRINAFGVFVLFVLADLFFVKIFGSDQLLKFYYICAFWFLGFFLITFFWKISGHLAIATLFFLLILRWFGESWWPVIFIIPLVAWARIKSKNHSLSQVIAGVLYSLFTTLLLDSWIIK